MVPPDAAVSTDVAHLEAARILAPLGQSTVPEGIRKKATLPEISRFLGIIIAMFYRDHQPPHFHAIYGDYEVVVNIENGVIEGRFPRRAVRLVLEWYELHREELMEDWLLAEQRKPLKKIAPLE
jgi:Domain of unknown function (DUF4160)